jgi:hypothetical protein
MKPSSLLTAAIYLAFLGTMMQLFPRLVFGLDANAPALLIGNFRVVGSSLFVIAVINWFARNSDASRARDAIFLGTMVMFVFGAIGDFILSMMPGGDPIGFVFVFINLSFAIAFFVVGRANMSTNANLKLRGSSS